MWEPGPPDRMYATGRTEAYAWLYVLINANPGVYAKHYETGQEIRWEQVCHLPWPEDHPDGYGPAPEGWPYGNGCAQEA